MLRRVDRAGRIIDALRLTGATNGTLVARLLTERDTKLPLHRPSQYANNYDWWLDMWESMPYLTQFVAPYQQRLERGSLSPEELTRIRRAHVYAAMELVDSLIVDDAAYPWLPNTPMPVDGVQMRAAHTHTMDSAYTMQADDDDEAIILTMNIETVDGFENISPGIEVVWSRDYRERPESVSHEWDEDYGGMGGWEYFKWQDGHSIECDVHELSSGGSEVPPLEESDVDEWNVFIDDVQDGGATDESWPRCVRIGRCVGVPAYDEDDDPRSRIARIELSVSMSLVDDALVRRPRAYRFFREKVDFYYNIFPR
jgi:hypothetical protein